MVRSRLETVELLASGSNFRIHLVTVDGRGIDIGNIRLFAFAASIPDLRVIDTIRCLIEVTAAVRLLRQCKMLTARSIGIDLPAHLDACFFNQQNMLYGLLSSNGCPLDGETIY